MHKETKAERDRIYGKIHDFCRGETMIGKGCVQCPLNEINVCNDGGNKASTVPMSRLKEAEKTIDEVMKNDKL